jgi:hypothetical protein
LYHRAGIGIPTSDGADASAGLVEEIAERCVLKQDLVVVLRGEFRTPGAAAIVGILFSILLIISLVLIWISVPVDPQDAGTWLSRGWKTVSLRTCCRSQAFPSFGSLACCGTGWGPCDGKKGDQSLADLVRFADTLGIRSSAA